MPASLHTYTERIDLFSKVNKLAVSFNNANPKNQTMVPIDLSNQEVLSFLRALQDRGVRYLMISGFAMAFYGHIRATLDLDLWIEDGTENLDKLKQVPIDSGVAGLEKARSFDLTAGFTQFAIGQSGFVIDPMKHLKAFQAFDFNACYARAESGSYGGVTFKVIHPSDLLKEKEATNRPKDQGDIEHLRSQTDKTE